MQYFASPNGTNIRYGQSLYGQSGSFAGDKLHLRDTAIGIKMRDNPYIAGDDTPRRNISRDYNGVQLVYHILLQPGFYTG